MNFAREKEARLGGLDLSRKGSIDEGIAEFLKFINNIDCFYSTSSCAGRTVIFTCKVHGEHSGQQKNSGDQEVPCLESLKKIIRSKKGCNWLLVSHEILKSEDVVDVLKNHEGSAVLKFEPFILHLRCCSLPDAQKMHAVCTSSGFRNSGITISKSGKITLAVRSTMKMEVPLSDDGLLLVSNEYLGFLVREANRKMKENWSLTERLFNNIISVFDVMPMENEKVVSKREEWEKHSDEEDQTYIKEKTSVKKKNQDSEFQT